MADEQESSRPYRIWDPGNDMYLRWRCFKYPRNAHLGALIEARWAKPGVVYEVIDIRTMAALGQYRRNPTSVSFINIKTVDNAKEDKG